MFFELINLLPLRLIIVAAKHRNLDEGWTISRGVWRMMVAEHLAWRACTTSKCSRNVPLSKCLTLRTMDVSLITLVCSFVLYMRARCMSCLADSQRLRYHLSKGTKEIFCNFDTYFSCGYLLHAKYFIRLLLRSAILFILLEINNQTILFIVIFVFFFFFLLPLRVFVFIHFLFDANFSS